MLGAMLLSCVLLLLSIEQGQVLFSGSNLIPKAVLAEFLYLGIHTQDGHGAFHQGLP